MIRAGITQTGTGPDPVQLLRDADHRLARAASEARDAAVDEVHRDAPGSFARDSVKGRVTKTATGYEIVVQPVKRKRSLARLVSGGTGIHGPKRRPIKGKRGPMTIRGRQYAQIDGQKPNPFMQRGRPRALDAARDAIERVLRGGA